MSSTRQRSSRSGTADVGLYGSADRRFGSPVGWGPISRRARVPRRSEQWTAISLGVYSVRMARVNITMPDDLHAEAKRAGLNISQVAQQAVAAELTRLAKVAELDAYLAELDAELGPISDRDRADAKAWADKVLGADRRRRSA